MTDKPEIKVGQRWLTRCGDVVRILATDSHGIMPIVVDSNDGVVCKLYPNGTYRGSPEIHDEMDLISLAPATVKRDVALYRYEAVDGVVALETAEAGEACRISEPVTIEFTLLPGESA